jgi:hypothetical protein
MIVEKCLDRAAQSIIKKGLWLLSGHFLGYQSESNCEMVNSTVQFATPIHENQQLVQRATILVLFAYLIEIKFDSQHLH